MATSVGPRVPVERPRMGPKDGYAPPPRRHAPPHPPTKCAPGAAGPDARRLSVAVSPGKEPAERSPVEPVSPQQVQGNNEAPPGGAGGERRRRRSLVMPTAENVKSFVSLRDPEPRPRRPTPPSVNNVQPLDVSSRYLEREDSPFFEELRTEFGPSLARPTVRSLAPTSARAVRWSKPPRARRYSFRPAAKPEPVTLDAAALRETQLASSSEPSLSESLAQQAEAAKQARLSIVGGGRNQVPSEGSSASLAGSDPGSDPGSASDGEFVDADEVDVVVSDVPDDAVAESEEKEEEAAGPLAAPSKDAGEPEPQPQPQAEPQPQQPADTPPAARAAISMLPTPEREVAAAAPERENSLASVMQDGEAEAEAAAAAETEAADAVTPLPGVAVGGGSAAEDLAAQRARTERALAERKREEDAAEEARVAALTDAQRRAEEERKAHDRRKSVMLTSQMAGYKNRRASSILRRTPSVSRR